MGRVGMEGWSATKHRAKQTQKRHLSFPPGEGHVETEKPHGRRAGSVKESNKVLYNKI